MEKELKQSWFRKHLILTIILGIIAIAVISGGLVSCTKPNQSQGIVCPELSNAILYGYDEQADAWIAEKIDYSTETEKLVFDERVEWRTSTPEDRGFPDLEPNKVYYMCDSGSRHIELGNAGDYNPNYVYCGDFIRPIVLYKLDANGNIINDIRTSVEIIFDSKTKNYVDTKCGTYTLINAMQTEESSGMSPSISIEPAPLPQTTSGYVYDNKLNYGFDYPDNWGFSISVDKDVERCDPTQYHEEYNCVDFPDSNIKKVISFTKTISKDGSLISADIEFMAKSAVDLQEVTNKFKKEAEMSGLPILNEETISVNNVNGYDMLVGEESGWKLRQVVFFANGTAYIFTYQSQDEPYRMYEATFNSIINSFNI